MDLAEESLKCCARRSIQALVNALGGGKAHQVVRATRRLGLLGLPLMVVGLPPSAAAAGEGAERPVIVWGGSSDVAATAVATAGGEVGPALALIGGVAAHLDDAEWAAVLAAGLHVADDSTLTVAADSFTPPALSAQKILGTQYAELKTQPLRGSSSSRATN